MRGKGGSTDNTPGETAGLRLHTILKQSPFHTSINEENGDTIVWLKEFAMYGIGDDLEKAQTDLVQDVRNYVEEYQANEELQKAPNTSKHRPMVILAEKADQKGILDKFLFAKIVDERS